jgi:hypothetical protein
MQLRVNGWRAFQNDTLESPQALSRAARLSGQFLASKSKWRHAVPTAANDPLRQKIGVPELRDSPFRSLGESMETARAHAGSAMDVNAPAARATPIGLVGGTHPDRKFRRVDDSVNMTASIQKLQDVFEFTDRIDWVRLGGKPAHLPWHEIIDLASWSDNLDPAMI